MKKLSILIILICLSSGAWAQAPENMNYYAVVKNASNGLVTNQKIRIEMSILEGAEGTAVYLETHRPTTSSNGLVNISLGTGTAILGTFNTIDWSKGSYFSKMEIDPALATTYSISCIGEIKFMPHASTAGNDLTAAGSKGQVMFWNESSSSWEILDLQTGDANLVRRNGKIVWTEIEIEEGTKQNIGFNKNLGGYVFYVTPNFLHGLVAAMKDQGRIKWIDTPSLVNNITAHDAEGKNFMDWRLPTKNELHMMYEQKDQIGGFHRYFYWSSSEYDNTHLGAWEQNFLDGYQYHGNQDDYGSVRAVRDF